MPTGFAPSSWIGSWTFLFLPASFNHESGLLGISETSSDMRDLLEHEKKDVRAAEAVALFCYQAKKWIGAYVAALGGLDTVVFAGGIGENAPIVRARICEGLNFFGIELDKARQRQKCRENFHERQADIVRVIRTDEELMIARSVMRTCPNDTFSRTALRSGYTP